jgi:hypothetical protein
MKRERLESPATEANWAAVPKRGATAELTFFIAPPNWESAAAGVIYLHARYGGEPLAYMMVRNGEFYDDLVFRNSSCQLDETLGIDQERILFYSLRNQVIAGCTALVEKHWPLALKK